MLSIAAAAACLLYRQCKLDKATHNEGERKDLDTVLKSSVISGSGGAPAGAKAAPGTGGRSSQVKT